MSPTRRLFLHNAAFSTIAAGFFPAALAQRSLIGRSQAFSDEELAALSGVSMQTFEPWIGSSFHVSLNRKPMGALVLVSVEDGSQEAKEGSDSPELARPIGQAAHRVLEPDVSSFSLRFRGSGAALPQDTYLLSHDWLGTFPLFLVPSGLKTHRPTCTAVFTLMNKKLRPVKPE